MGEIRTHESDRWSYLWLALAAVGGLFVGGKWAVPLAAWVFPIFLLRFLRTQKLWPGLALGYLALVVPAILTFQGMAPGMEGISYVVFMVVMSAIAYLDYVADRLIATRIPGFASTLVYPWGRVLGQTDYFGTDDAVLVAQVPTQGVPTLYARIGPLFGWLCVAGLVAFAGWAIVSGVRLRLRRRRDRPESIA